MRGVGVWLEYVETPIGAVPASDKVLHPPDLLRIGRDEQKPKSSCLKKERLQLPYSPG